MDDDAGDWFTQDDDAPAEDTVADVPAAAAAAGDAAPAGDAAGGEVTEEAPAPPPEPEEIEEPGEFLDPDRLMLCKHWIRPRFLQYKYLFDYRHNYYNDVIEYMDNRNKGLIREYPHPQTWAERLSRSYRAPHNRSDFYKRLEEDQKLATKLRLTGAFYHYHTREYFNHFFKYVRTWLRHTPRGFTAVFLYTDIARQVYTIADV